MGLIGAQETADTLGCKVRLLYSPDFRETIGLPVIRIGHKMKFDPADIERVIREQKEVFPTRGNEDETAGK